MSFRQLNVGRDEPILDPDLPIVDAHHHLFVRPAIRYMLDEFIRDVQSGHRIVASVYVETQSFVRRSGPSMMRPLGEVEFANGIGAIGESGVYGGCRVCAGIVGHADLRNGAAIGEYLDSALALAPLRFRGVRQMTLDDPTEVPYRFIPVRPDRGITRHPKFNDGLREVARRGLTFDAAMFHHQLADVCEMADTHPNLTIVLNHSGHAMALDCSETEKSEIFQEWRSWLFEIAKRPNVVTKIGGLGLPFWGLGLDERIDPIGSKELAEIWRPYVESAIEAFGVDRSMMESNYPVDSRSAGYVPAWNAMKIISQGATRSEKEALFSGTAARVYRLDLSECI